MNIRQLILLIPLKSLKRLFGLFFFLALIVFIVFGITGTPLTTSTAPMGIISFELAGSVGKAEAILSSWNSAARERAAFSIGFDFLFIPIYVLALGLGCSLASRSIVSRRWPLEGLGYVLIWGVVLAGLCDIIENTALLIILFEKVDLPWPQISAGFAYPKFGLIFLGLVYSLYGGVVSLVIKPQE